MSMMVFDTESGVVSGGYETARALAATGAGGCGWLKHPRAEP